VGLDLQGDRCEVAERASGRVWIGGEGCKRGARVEDMGRESAVCVQLRRLRGEWGWVVGGRRSEEVQRPDCEPEPVAAAV
jgi:hypothetical protein